MALLLPFITSLLGSDDYPVVLTRTPSRTSPSSANSSVGLQFRCRHCQLGRKTGLVECFQTVQTPLLYHKNRRLTNFESMRKCRAWWPTLVVGSCKTYMWVILTLLDSDSRLVPPLCVESPTAPATCQSEHFLTCAQIHSWRLRLHITSLVSHICSIRWRWC